MLRINLVNATNICNVKPSDHSYIISVGQQRSLNQAIHIFIGPLRVLFQPQQHHHHHHHYHRVNYIYMKQWRIPTAKRGHLTRTVVTKLFSITILPQSFYLAFCSHPSLQGTLAGKAIERKTGTTKERKKKWIE